jgi:hypothetical protein
MRQSFSDPGEFATVGRTRVAGQTLNCRGHAVVDISSQSAERFFRRAFQEDAIHGLLTAARGEVIFERTVMLRLGARTLEPGEIASVFRAFQQFLVVLDGENDGNQFAAARHHFRFKQWRFHGRNLAFPRRERKGNGVVLATGLVARDCRQKRRTTRRGVQRTTRCSWLARLTTSVGMPVSKVTRRLACRMAKASRYASVTC